MKLKKGEAWAQGGCRASEKKITLPKSLYRSESWTLKARGINRIQSIEMRYLRTLKNSSRFQLY
jgi:hypothetical protein